MTFAAIESRAVRFFSEASFEKLAKAWLKNEQRLAKHYPHADQTAPGAIAVRSAIKRCTPVATHSLTEHLEAHYPDLIADGSVRPH